MGIETIVVLGLLGAIVAYGIMLYNSLVQIKHNVTKAWANIDVLLKQRHDELPKLVGKFETTADKFSAMAVKISGTAEKFTAVGEQTKKVMTGVGELTEKVKENPSLLLRRPKEPPVARTP